MTRQAPSESPSQAEHVNVKVKGQDGEAIHFRIKLTTPLSKLMDMYGQHRNLDRHRFKFLFYGISFLDNQTPLELGMQDDDEIDVFSHEVGGCVAAPMDPAIFGLLTGSLGARFLASPITLTTATPEDAQQLVADLHGNSALKPQSVAEGDVIVGASARDELIKHLDALHAKALHGPPRMNARMDDLVVGLSEIEARSFLGTGCFERLASHFGAPIDAIKLRRVSAIGKFVPFHTDYSLKTMQVALNDDFTGGELVFATGEGFLVPVRPAGTAMVHTSRQLHGVAKLEAGVRYGLFFCHTGTESQDAPAEGSLNELLAPALAQLDFFEEALPWLEGASVDELEQVVTVYAAFLRAARGTSPPLAAPSLGLEVAWRTHFVRLELCDGVSRADLVADFLQPASHGSLSDAFTKCGKVDVRAHVDSFSLNRSYIA